LKGETRRRFDGKTAIVTGGASGIGAKMARRLSGKGDAVVVVGRDHGALSSVSLPGRHLLRAADVMDPAAVEEVISETVDTFGGVDVVMSNAGIWRQQGFLDISPSDWDAARRTNLTGSFLLCQAAARRRMTDTPGGGAIVVTASTNSFVAEPETAHYNASKGLWRQGLEERDVVAWTGDGRVGLSPHLYNSRSDIDKAVTAVKDIAHSLATQGMPEGADSAAETPPRGSKRRVRYRPAEHIWPTDGRT